jgi:CheY-like chemotaxis protein/signal transduction histidine kinase
MQGSLARLITGHGEMAARVRELPWNTYELGPIERWPIALRTAVTSCLAARSPMQLWWGEHAIVIYNDAAIQLLGAAHPIALGRRASEVLGERWSALGGSYAQLLREAAPARRGRIALTPIHDDHGRVAGALWVHDPAHGELLASLADQLRDPLGAMFTNVQALLLRAPSPEADAIAHVVRQLSGAIDHVVDLSRLARGEQRLRRSRIELAQLVNRACELVGPIVRARGVRLAQEIARSGLPVDTDRERFERVLASLLASAMPRSHPDATLTVRATREHERIRLTIAAVPGDAAADGRTLGRALSGNVIELHGGTLADADHGYVLELPVAAAGEVAMPPVAFAKTPRPRLLIVEDHDEAARGLKLALEQRGYDVALAHDGPVALRVASAFKPHVVLIDIGLPVMDGWELARRLAERERALRFIAITGRGQELDVRRSAELGFVGHLVKPVDLERLEDAIGAESRALAAARPG